MKIINKYVGMLLLALFASAAASGQAANAADKPLPAIAEKTASMQKHDGFLPLYWDDRHGKVYLEIPNLNEDLLLIDSLPAGVGSNDIGLDRGQPGSSRLVRFERVLLVQQNVDFRATSNNPLEQRAVSDAFARSVLWGFDVAAESDGHVLVDATPYLLTDIHGVVQALKRTKQGSFHIDGSRSAIYLPATKNFPLNTEVENILTFTSDEPGKFVREVTPDPHAITVREHFSFIHLPQDGYKPREFDPRAGYFDMTYLDYSAPAGAQFKKRFIVRHRLQKKDPSAAMSEPVKPIIYYLDPGTPEPIRSALLEGASWWNQAFEAAGYKNAFRVEMLPPDVDPADIRYNIIEWVHRSTRGWAYGSAIIDPRTGEIINGHVSLDSQRWRQDYRILEGMLAPYKDGTKTDPRLLQTVLARIRQLAAHELGHTLGLAHNYISSAQGRTSVMDYPPPLLKLGADGSIDVNDAYATGIGAWDKVSITYGYSDFAPGTDEHAALNKIIDDARHHGLTFLTDQDARPAGSSHPQVHLWDAGTNAADELDRVLKVRARAMQRFGEDAIEPGTPMAMLADTLVPVYYYHRYQTTAAIKMIGGQSYTYAMRGDGQVPVTPVSAADQRHALRSVMETIDPVTLSIPFAQLIPPHPAGDYSDRESPPSRIGLNFDPQAMAEAAAQKTLSLLLDPERASRLIEQETGLVPTTEKPLGLGEVLDAVIQEEFKVRSKLAYQQEIRNTEADVALREMLALAMNDKASADARAVTRLKLHELGQWLDNPPAGYFTDELSKAHRMYLAAQIRDFENHPSQFAKPAEPLTPPPGQPIGSDVEDDFVIPHMQ